MIRKTLAISCAAFAPVASAAAGDEIADTIESALKAYQYGDIQYALEELAYAKQKLNLMNAEVLSQFLPSATAGWSRQVDTDFSKTLGGVDGGARNEGGGENLKITLLADNPMVASMDGLFGGADFFVGKMVRIGREKFIEPDNG